MGAVAAGASIVGGIISAKGQLDAAGDAEQAAKRNAYLGNLAAADAIKRGDVDANIVRQKGAQVLGKQQAAYAASGVDLGSGSAAAVQADTAQLSEQDAQTAKNNAAREAWGYRTQGIAYGQQASREHDRGMYGAGSSVLGGISSAASILSRK